MRRSQSPSETNVRLLRPPRALFTTFTLEGSNNATNGLPQPIAPGMPLAAVESPAIKMDGVSAAAETVPANKAMTNGRSLLRFFIELQPKVVVNHAARRRTGGYSQFEHVRACLECRGVKCYILFAPHAGNSVS